LLFFSPILLWWSLAAEAAADSHVKRYQSQLLIISLYQVVVYAVSQLTLLADMNSLNIYRSSFLCFLRGGPITWRYNRPSIPFNNVANRKSVSATFRFLQIVQITFQICYGATFFCQFFESQSLFKINYNTIFISLYHFAVDFLQFHAFFSASCSPEFCFVNFI